MPKFTIWAVFSLILLIAFFFRFYRLFDLPLGNFFDPAINGLDALRLMQRGGLVIFFPTNGGREALFMYLLIPYIWLFGSIPFSLRAPTAALSLLNVALLIGFLWDLRTLTAYRPGLRSTLHALRFYFFWLAALAGLALAVSYWHISASRLGQRPILVPTLSIPIFWFFLKGWTTGHRRWFILSGLLMGLAGYTYSAARLLPLILILTLLPEFWRRPPTATNDRQARPTTNDEQSLDPNSPNYTNSINSTNSTNSPLTFYVLRFTLFLLTALLVYLPMAYYLLTHPAQFTERAGSVMVWNFLETPGAILAELGRNLLRVAGFFCCAGSPNPIFGPPGYPGLSWLLTPFLLIGLILVLKNWRSLYPRLVAVWWVIGLAPSVLAIEAPHPWRMIVAVIPTAILIGLGALHTALWLAEHTKKRDHPEPLLSSLLTHQCEASLWDASLINAKPPCGTYHASGFTFYSSRFTLPLVLAFILILLPTPHLFQAYFNEWPRLQVTQGIYDYGAVAIRNTVLALADDPTPIYLPQRRFNDSTLLFYLAGSFERQAALTAPLAKQAWVIAPERNEAEAAWVRLQGRTATLLPPLTGQGQQLIQTALAQQARPIQTGSGETVAYLAPLATDPAGFTQQITRPQTATFETARLVGLAYPEVLEPATSTLPVTLFWQALQSMPEEYEVVLQLVDDSRRSWGHGSGRPTGWIYPTSFWRPGLDEVAVQHRLLIETEQLPPGRYWLAISLFEAATGRRQRLAGPLAGSPDTFLAGPLKSPWPAPPAQTVAALRQTSPLSPALTFGEMIQLNGVQLVTSTLKAGQAVELKLLWQARQAPDRDYTVFIHLLDRQDNLVAGFDSQPLAGRYPTAIWSPGELILEQRSLPTPPDLAAGQYRLAIGLYHQPSGARLSLRPLPGQSNGADRFILSQLLHIRR